MSQNMCSMAAAIRMQKWRLDRELDREVRMAKALGHPVFLKSVRKEMGLYWEMLMTYALSDHFLDMCSVNNAGGS